MTNASDASSKHISGSGTRLSTDCAPIAGDGASGGTGAIDTASFAPTLTSEQWRNLERYFANTTTRRTSLISGIGLHPSPCQSNDRTTNPASSPLPIMVLDLLTDHLLNEPRQCVDYPTWGKLLRSGYDSFASTIRGLITLTEPSLIKSVPQRCAGSRALHEWELMRHLEELQEEKQQKGEALDVDAHYARRSLVLKRLWDLR